LRGTAVVDEIDNLVKAWAAEEVVPAGRFGLFTDRRISRIDFWEAAGDLRVISGP